MKSINFSYYDGEKGLNKDVRRSFKNDLTLGEVRALFYDFCAAIGYQVQETDSDNTNIGFDE